MVKKLIGDTINEIKPINFNIKSNTSIDLSNKNNSTVSQMQAQNDIALP